MADLVGSAIGRYRIVSKLGRGGMAEVYKAFQPSLQRYVAIKVMLGHMVDDQDFVDRFEREALNTSKLTHPNIVKVIDFDSEYGKYYMVMDYIDGPTLKSEIKARKVAEKPFTFKEIARIFSALCSAVDYAHARKMIHRDIKPANVMINQEGEVVLTDFGIVRSMEGTQHTATGALTGTPAYMSPEQGRGERADERSDIYALGVMLYEMVTGDVPYDADTPFAVIMKHINEPLPLPSKVNPEVTEGIENIVLKAMAKHPDDRYQTASAMAKELRDSVDLSYVELNRPVTTLAPKSTTADIDHDTGPITAEEKQHSRVRLGGGQATVVSTAGEQATVTSQTGTSSDRKLPIVPIAIGGGVLLLLALIGIFFVSSQSSSNAAATAEMLAISETEAAEAEADRATSLAIAAAETEAAGESTSTDEPEDESTPTATVSVDTPTPIPPGTPQGTIKESAQIWLEPDDESQLLGRLNPGAIVEVVGGDEAGTWWRIKTALSSNGFGWIKADEETVSVTSQVNVPIAVIPTKTPTPTSTPPPTATETDEPPTDTPVPVDTNTPTPAPLPTDTATLGPPTDTPTATSTPTPEAPAIAGKLAFPVDNGSGAYDVFIYSLPDGDQLGRINGARQPNFRLDGETLLVNGQSGSFGENVFEFTGLGNNPKVVSESPTDLHPVYKPDGSTLAFGNPNLATGSQGIQPYIFVQCSLKVPNQEGDQSCNDIAGTGIIVPDGQIGDIIGSNPVWTVSDQLAFKGCGTWPGGSSGSCGIYLVPSWATSRNGGVTPRVKLVDGGSTIPTDSKAGLVAFQSRESGNWDAYVISEGGGTPINLSDNPADDGLPTISPDGSSVIFASNRDGGWAFYVVSSSGGEATKVFDFPKGNPWATGDRDWTTERISWGP